jgi:multicomponent Na+:H+ antiporter subunit D
MIPPALFFILGALIIPFIPKKIRPFIFVFLGAMSLITVLSFSTATRPITVKVMNYTLVLLKANKLNKVFGIIFAFIFTAGGIFSYHIKETGQRCAALLYAGGALGVTFAGDFFTLFMFWELMAISSTYLIWARRTEESRKAGTRYIIYHALGGGILLAGILFHVSRVGGNLNLSLIADNGSLGGWLILIGVIINAAVPPLHAWLSDAYPKATITGAVFLSAFTTKTAVYVLARLFFGWKILLILGVIMTLYGVVYAVLANDIRGILAYHIISQVGYMVTGIGIGTVMSMNGTVSHAFSHILYKALLFMGTGAVIYSTGKSKLTQLGGLGKHLKWVALLYMVAAFSISGFPFFNGFISKSMIVAAAGEAHLPTVMLLLNLAAVGTFLSVGLKLPYFTFFSKDKPVEIEVKPIPSNMYVGMGLVAVMCVFYGLAPQFLYNLLPRSVEWHPYTMHHLVEVVQILIFTFIAFWIFRKKMLKPKDLIAIDVDWFYRKPKSIIRKIFVDGTVFMFSQVDRFFIFLTHKLVDMGKNPAKYFFKLQEKNPKYSPDKYRVAISLLLFTVIFLVLFMFVISR